jgi:hypothetical protein
MIVSGPALSQADAMTNSGGEHRNASRNAGERRAAHAPLACNGGLAMQMASGQGKQCVEGKTANGDG